MYTECEPPEDFSDDANAIDELMRSNLVDLSPGRATIVRRS
jgi:hypothetical protein